MNPRWLAVLGACRDETDADGDGFPAGEDCDEGNPDVNPGAVEVWYDETDQNCEPNDDATLVFTRVPGSEEGTRPAGPRFARQGDVVQLNMIFENDGMNTAARGTATFDGETGDLVNDRYLGLSQDSGLFFELGRTLDAAGYPGTDDLVAASMVTVEGDLRAALMIFEEETYSFGGSGPTAVIHFDDMAIQIDEDDVISVAGCGPIGTSWQSGTLDAFASTTQETAVSDLEGHNCEVVGGDVRLLDETGVVTEISADGSELLAAGETWSDVVDFAWEPGAYLLARDDHLVLESTSGSTDIPTSEPAGRVRLDVSGDQVFIVYANKAGDLYILYGPPDGPFLEGLLGKGLAKADLDIEATKHALFVGARTAADVWYASA
jgi:hypothetical protein